MLLLVRPKHFGFNSQTVSSNVFQQTPLDDIIIHERALKEFDAFIELLQLHQIEHIVFEDTDLPMKPDAIFPNNWFSVNDKRQVVLYPMLAANRRAERRQDIIEALIRRYAQHQVIDLTVFENEGKYLEGTGSMVLDKKLKYAYVCRSQRSNESVLDVFCEQCGYEKVIFDACTSKGAEIYHTNVMMSIGIDVCVIAAELIRDETQRKMVLEHLEQFYQLVLLTEEQVMHYCGNILFVKNQSGKGFWLMSTNAFQTFSNEQKRILEKEGTLLAAQVDTIEQCGGGSVRCMLAEL